MEGLRGAELLVKIVPSLRDSKLFSLRLTRH